MIGLESFIAFHTMKNTKIKITKSIIIINYIFLVLSDIYNIFFENNIIFVLNTIFSIVILILYFYVEKKQRKAIK